MQQHLEYHQYSYSTKKGRQNSVTFIFILVAVYIKISLGYIPVLLKKKRSDVVIARSLELMPPLGQKSGLREAGVIVVYVIYTWGI